MSRSAVAAFRGRVRERRQRQVAGAATGAEIRFNDGGMVTSGSFNTGSSRWAADVKGKPVKPVRSTLDIVCTAGLGRRA